jgi:AraC family transcriptional regulator
MMETRIIHKEPIYVVGISLQTLLKDEREKRNISKLHQEFEERITEIKNRVDENSIGIFIDPPDYDYRTDTFKWLAGVEVSNINEIIPDGMESITIPSNTYACSTYRGLIDQAHKAYDYLYKWVKESQYELADTYGIEQYRERNEKTAEGIMDLYFPIKKK